MALCDGYSWTGWLLVFISKDAGYKMIEEIERIKYVKVVEYSWTTESFNKRTGNNCKKFKPNHHTNEVI